MENRPYIEGKSIWNKSLGKSIEGACLQVKSFPVEPRAHALKIWIRSQDALCDECTHIFLAEPDYVFVKPPRFPIPPRGEAIGFTYDYVAPNYGENKKV